MRILLQGYYGFGNLGDDVLMKVTHAFIKRVFSEAEITVFSNEATGLHRYIYKILGPDIRIINYSASERFDFIVHGGGGIHYDFNEGRSRFRLLNALIRLIGTRYYLKLYTSFKRVKGKENISTNFRLGIGIGVGTFTPSSEKFYSSLAILGAYNYLLVRDTLSVRNSKAVNKHAIIQKSTDLAFLRPAWTNIQSKAETSSDKKIGIVLRGWKHDESHIVTILNQARKWSCEGIKVSFFFFEKNHDAQLVEFVNGVGETFVWDPQVQNFEDFFTVFSNQSLVITTRFHGSILASAVGMPSIGIAIEPKLQTVQEMLPSVKIIKLPVSEQKLSGAIQEFFRDEIALRRQIQLEFERNSNLIQSDLNDVERVLKNYAETSKISS